MTAERGHRERLLELREELETCKHVRFFPQWTVMNRRHVQDGDAALAILKLLVATPVTAALLQVLTVLRFLL